MGCQCEYCKNYKNNKLKRIEYKKQFENESYFKSIVPYSSFNLNDEFYYIKNVEINNFDPLCGSIYEYYIDYAIRTNKLKLNFNLEN